MFKQATKAMAIILVVALLCVSVHAATPRSVSIVPTLTFSGTTANCHVLASGDSDDEIVIKATLWYGVQCIGRWSTSGTGYASTSGTAAVESGKQYKLTADVTVNGIKQSPVSQTKVCN